jgi:DNA-directed RNA polymerase
LVARLISKSIPPDRLPEAVKVAKKSEGSIKTKNAVVGAAKIKKEQMTSVIWTTPLGLPIVQPYRKTKRKQIMTSLQTVFISDPNSPAGGKCCLLATKLNADGVACAVNSTKQASAFPPNFIHSLDATHMMLTALECRVCCL